MKSFHSRCPRYRLITVWRIDAPVQRVYEAICRTARWPSWWWGVKNVAELEPGDELSVGRLLRCSWQGLLPYTHWHFSQEGPTTSVRYEWRVRTTKQWMNLLAPVAGPLFRWNHNLIMRAGGEGLARLLDARLISLAHE